MGLFPTFKKYFFIISRFILFSTLNKNNIEKFPFTYWLYGRWFLQIVDRDSWIYIHYGFFFRKQFFLISHFILFSTLKKYWKVPLHLLVKWEVVSHLFPSYDFVSQIWGGGGCNVFLTFCAISNISRKKNLGIQNNYLSFNVLFVFFCMLEIL